MLKKVILLFAVLSGSASAQSVTPNIGLQLPSYNSSNWGTQLNYDLTRLDGYLSGGYTIPNLSISTLTTPTVNATVNGYQINGTAPLNHFLIGNGTYYVDTAQIPAGSLPSSYTNFQLFGTPPFIGFAATAGGSNYAGLTSPSTGVFDFGNGTTGDASGTVDAATVNATTSVTTPVVIINTGAALATYATGPSIDQAEIDASGNIWWADYIDNVVKVMSPTGTILHSYAQTISPTIVNFDPYGNAWICQQANNTIIKMTPAGVVTGPFAAGTSPDYAAFDQEGNVWIADTGSNNVTELNNAGTLIGTFSTGATGTNPWGIAIDSGGNVWTSNHNTNNLSEISPKGVLVQNVPVGNGPITVAIDSAGYLWVSNQTDNTVSKLFPDGSPMFTVPSGGTGLSNLAIDGSDHIWAANQNSNTLVEISSAGEIMGTFATGNGPTFVSIDALGNVWVPNLTDDTITKFASGAKGVKVPITPPGTGKNIPQANISVESIQVLGEYNSLFGPGNYLQAFQPTSDTQSGYLLYGLNAAGSSDVWGFAANGNFFTLGSVTAPTVTATTSVTTPVVLNTAAQTSVTCATSGTAVFSMPEQGASYKKVIVYENACIGAASYTFPTAFTYAPQVLSQAQAATATTVSATAVTVTGVASPGSTGFLELDGY